MKYDVVVACECSGIVREAFRKRGVNAVSVDLKDAEDGSPYHIKGDIRSYAGIEVIEHAKMLIAFPDCTYLCSSGIHWNDRGRGWDTTYQALDFVRWLMSRKPPYKCIENPKGLISTHIKKATQYIQPYDFGHDASKQTGLWLELLPPLKPTLYVEPRVIDGKKRWANQTDSGQNRLGPSSSRATDRARTYKGIGEAMAEQWIRFL